MYAKSTVYDKQRIAEQNGLTSPIEVFNFGARRYDVRAYRFIRVEWELEQVFGSNHDEEPSLWVRLDPLPAAAP